MGAAQSLTISAVILTANRRAWLQRCLHSLAGQSRELAEAVLIDNGSDEKAQDYLDPSGFPFELRIYDGLNFGSYAEARNFGASKATGDTILFIDDDCEADAPLAERLAEAMERDGWDAAGAVILPADPLDSPPGYTPELGWAAGLMGEGIFGPLAGRRFLPVTAGLLIRKRTLMEFPFQEVGGQFAGEQGYDFGREDAEWWRRLRRAGRPLTVVKRAIVWHGVPQQRLEWDSLLERAAADGRSHWNRERNEAELRHAARDIVYTPLALTAAAARRESVRDAYAAARLWNRRQWNLISAAVREPGAAYTPEHRLRSLLAEGAGAAISAAKAITREAALSVNRTLTERPDLPDPPDAGSILAVLHDLLGDAVLALPALCQFAAAFHKTSITVLTGPVAAPILRANVPENVRILETRRDERGGLASAWRLRKRLARKPHRAVLLLYCHGIHPAAFLTLPGTPPVVGWQEDNGLSQRFWAELLSHPVKKSFLKHESVALLDLLTPFRVETQLQVPKVSFTNAQKERAARILQEAEVAPGEALAVHFEPADRWKIWPEERMAELVRKLSSAGKTVFLVGSRAGRIAAESCGILPLPKVYSLHTLLDSAELGALLSEIKGVIGCDSGPIHLARAAGAKTAALFGATEPHRWGPLRETGEPECAVIASAPGDWLAEEQIGLSVNESMKLLELDTVWKRLEVLLAER